MSDTKIVSAKVPEDIYSELILRIPEGDRSDFIREAIMEKLQKTPKADKILQMEKRMSKIEEQLGEIHRYLSKLDLLTFGHQKADPYDYCIDEIDHKIVGYLIHYKGATTPELSEYMQINRWLILNRLRKIQKASQKQLGKAVIDYYGGEKSGKKKAWWINEEMVEGE